MFNQKLFDRLRERLFDPSQQAAYVRFGVARQHKQMHVFRHEYKRIEDEAFFVAGCVDAASQPFPPRIICKQRLATVARER